MSHTYDYFTTDRQQTKSSPYLGVSVFLHLCIAIGAAFVTVPILEKINEPVTIEIVESTPLDPIEVKPFTTEISKGDDVPVTQGQKTIQAPVASSTLDATEAKVVSAPLAKSKTSTAQIATLKTHTGRSQSPVTQVIETSAPSRAGVPETIEDIQAEQLDLDTVSVTQAGAFGEDELESDFKNIDRKSEAALRAQKSEMDAEARLISDQQEQALAAIENENSAQARAMTESLKATRTQNAATLAQIKASEAAAERAAREESDRQKAAAANSSAADSNGSGMSESGPDEHATAAAGSSEGVRSVENLRQIPGNPRPQYAMDERIRREQGKVIFHAFVTAQGTLENFKLVQSTGYKNLDGKSLAALKKWKFYPGQQGWVEIPQVWNLKGDIEKMPTLLRRQVSQR